MARVLFLRHHAEDSPGLVGEAFGARGFDLDLVLIDEGAPSPSLEGYDALVILGSKCAVYDLEGVSTWFDHEVALVAEAERRGVPVLGICFGAQVLCHFFGGVVSRAEESEIGWFDVAVANDVALPSGPWFEFHFDRCELPNDAQVWATSPLAVQAFAIGRHVGVQFHPELDEAQLKEWLCADTSSARDLGLDVEGLLAETAAETPRARERAAILVDLFLDR